MSDRPIRLGPFELGEPLGKGGMGEVFGGRHLASGLPVAVKVLGSYLAWDDSFREQFRNEVRAVARLDHPAIVMVFDHGEVSAEAAAASGDRLAEGAPYLVMEKLDGALAGASRPPGWVPVRVVLETILDALAHAHARDVIHRDIKLANVLVAHGGVHTLKLADFGIARALDSLGPSPWESGTIAGTPQYMAPEQILGNWRDQGPWTDLYSLGCVAWRLVTGRAPFGGRRDPSNEVMRGHLEDAPPPFRPRLPVPAGLEVWLRRLLEKHPHDRFTFAADARHALASIESASHVEWVLPAPSPDGTAEEPSDLVSGSEMATLSALDTQWSPPPPGTLTEDARARPMAERPTIPETWQTDAPSRPAVSLHGAGLGLYDLRPVPLVGRIEERDALYRELLRVDASRRPRVVLIRGLAGAGKSRLAEWLTERAHELGAASALQARHAPIRGPGQGIAAMVKEHLKASGLDRDDLFEHVRASLRRHAQTAGDDAVALLEEAVSLTAFVRGDRQSRAERAMTFGSFLTRVAMARPLIVWLDDVQWGHESLELVDEILLARGERELPVLFLLTAQDEALAEQTTAESYLHALCVRHDAARIELGPLPEAERHDLVTSLLGLDESLVRAVEERTAGNPLFAVQLVGDWVQRGVLVVGERGFELRAGERAPVPNDIHTAWRDRIGSMIAEHGGDDDAWRALELAAALGGEVVTREWEVAAEALGVAPPPQWIEPLLARRLAVGTRSAWSFVHGMLRESLARMADERGRIADHHRACAEMILRLHDPAARGVSERLARHRIAAGDLEAALEPMLDAAHEHIVTADFDRAAALLDERDRILDDLAVSETDPRRLAGWTERTRALGRRGQIEAAVEIAERLEELAKSSRHGGALYGEITRLRAFLFHRSGETSRSVELYRLAAERLAAAGDEAAAARALHGLAEVHAVRGELDAAEQCYREALAVHVETGDAQYRAHELSGLGNVLRQRGLLEDGARMIDEAMHLYDEVGDRLGAAICRNYLGEVARQRGDLEAAESYYELARERMRMLGSPDALLIQLNLCLVRLRRGAYHRAESLLRETLPQLDAHGLGGFAAFAHVALLACTAASEDWPAFDHHLERTRALLEASRIVDEDIAWPADLAADLAADAGDPDRAAHARAIATTQRQSLPRR